MYQGTQVTVGTTPTALWDGTRGRGRFLVTNDSDVTVYLGGSDVDTTGYRLQAGRSIVASEDSGEVLYAVVGTGTEDIDVLALRKGSA